MPYGLKRYQQSRQIHFVTFSCYRRLRHLGNPRVRDIFVECLERTRRSYRFRVYGYVVMPEHVHPLVSEPEVELLAHGDSGIEGRCGTSGYGPSRTTRWRAVAEALL